MVAGSLINTDDIKASFFIADKAEPIKEWGELYEPRILEDQRKVDWGITSSEDPFYQSSGDILDSLRNNVKTSEEIDTYCDNFENNMKQKQLSYLQVKSIEEGSDWYKQQFPKLPDDLCDIMARWNWGDLSELTKKKLKNDKKKIKAGKPNKKIKELYNLDVKKGDFVLRFD